MSRKAWFLGLAMTLAFAPGALADTIISVTNNTLGSGSNTLSELLTNGANCSCGDGVITGGGLDTFIGFSVSLPGNSLAGNSLTGASLTLGYGGAATGQDAIVSVHPVDATGPFTPSRFFVNGFESTTLTSIQSGAHTLALAGSAPPNGTVVQTFDLFALGFGPDLLAGNGVLVTGLADFHLDSQGIIESGFNAITQHDFITEGTYFAGGTLTENFTPIPPPLPVPEPSSLSLLCTGLLAGLGTVGWRRL